MYLLNCCVVIELTKKKIGLKRAERESKTRFHPRLTVFFSALLTCALSGYLVEVFSEPSWLYPFGADSLSRSVHCAPDENDRPSERTKFFKITSVYVPVYIGELTRT